MEEKKKLLPGELDWDSPLEGNSYEEIIADGIAACEEDWAQAVKYLEAVFKPGDIVGFVNSAYLKNEKWVPAKGCLYLERDRIIKALKKSKNLDDAFATINPQSGAWIGLNPFNKEGKVTRYDHVLVVSNSVPVEEQVKMLLSFKLPIVSLVESGGDTVHAVVRIDAKDYGEYKQRTELLYDWLAKHNFVVDRANADPARLTRLPGAKRGDKIQRLEVVNPKQCCESWLDWIDWKEGIDDDLPRTVSLWDQIQDPPEESPELISGILRQGCKMILIGESKAGKTCMSQQLAVCIATGTPWLGKWSCQKGKVLYINLEVEEASLFKRFAKMYEALGIPFNEETTSNIISWNLRGKALPLELLAAKIIRRCRNMEDLKMIILDPLYKVQNGDENSAEAISKFCNALDRIAHETGAAIVYDHHNPKGHASAERKAIDRGAGSGVFARDADALASLSFLDPSQEVQESIKAQLDSGEKPMQIEFVLRDFPDIKPVNLFFKFPVHYIDKTGSLNGVPLEGSREANLQKSGKRDGKPDRKKAFEDAYFSCCDDQGRAKIKDMAKKSGISDRTIRRYVEEDLKRDYFIENGFVRKKMWSEPATVGVDNAQVPSDLIRAIQAQTGAQEISMEDLEAQRQQLAKEFEEMSEEAKRNENQ